MRVVSVAVTARGRAGAARLPYEVATGSIATTVRDRWADVDGFVLFAATGIAVRVIAPLLADKRHDPAVVCVDETGRWVIALSGGHAGGNDLAREVAALLGGEAVVSTATDNVGKPAIDGIGGCRAVGDVAGVSRALVDGAQVWIDNRAGWPLMLSGPTGAGPGPGVVVTDAAVVPAPQTVVLHPPTLVVGIGSSSAAPADDLRELAETALAEAGLSVLSVSAIATIDRKRDEPAIVALAAAWDVPLHDLPADRLATVAVPNPSEVVARTVGTPSVAEAAALVVGGAGAALVVEKRASGTATVAVARRRPPPGHLAIVGIGPGGATHRTPAATTAVRHADVVIGYGPYVDLVADAIGPAATVVRSPIGEEAIRAKQALTEAALGRRVALVCSGDAGVYALATLTLELAPSVGAIEIDIVPGVTAALASAAVLGAPLGHDHLAISLSDLLTPWEVIAMRLRAAAEADFVVSVYNPRSAGRHWQLEAAVAILRSHRPPTTPVGLVTDAGRAGERAVITTIAEFDASIVTMTTCVIVGSSSTRMIDGRMVTPRGYTP